MVVGACAYKGGTVQRMRCMRNVDGHVRGMYGACKGVQGHERGA